jgi:uncharacterized RDD family membrane protein YckC
VTAYSAPPDPTAVVGRRIGAWLIDLVIYLVVAFAVTAMTGGVRLETGEFPNERSAELYCDAWQDSHDGFCSRTSNSDGTYDVTTIEGGFGGLAVWAGHLVAYSVIQGLLGGSLGKIAVGLRVVDEDGKVIGIGRSFARTIAWIGDAITCGLPIVGGVMMVSNKGHRRLGDMLAGTYVVSKSSVGTPIRPGQPDAGAWTTPAAGQWGAPSGPGSWGQPSTGQFGAGSAPGSWAPPSGPVSGPPVGAPGAPAGDGPTWDPARNAYIQFDRNLGEWVQWDDDLKIWGPIAK